MTEDRPAVAGRFYACVGKKSYAHQATASADTLLDAQAAVVALAVEEVEVLEQHLDRGRELVRRLLQRARLRPALTAEVEEWLAAEPADLVCEEPEAEAEAA